MDARSIAIVMITVDRSPGENYLDQTVRNLTRGGLFSSLLIDSFQLFYSNGNTQHFTEYIPMKRAVLHLAECDWQACENAGRALKIGAESGAPWILFCEDDIDVCSNFLESVATWLGTYALDQYRIYSFASPYPHLRQLAETGDRSWVCPNRGFYGTQCFAIRSIDAEPLGDYLLANPSQRNPNQYDLMITDWLDIHYSPHAILCSVPSFVEHIGIESICNPRPTVHRSPSWPGKEWSYV